MPASGRRGASFQLRACASCVSHVRRDPVPFLLRALMWTAVTAAAIVGRAGGGGARAAVIASAVALVVLVVALEVRGRRPLPVPAASEGEHRGAAGVRDVGGDRATYVVGSCHHDWLDDLVEINADAYDAVHASSEPQALAAARDASLRHVVAGNAAPGAAPHASTLDLPAVKAFAAAELQPAIGSEGWEQVLLASIWVGAPFVISPETVEMCARVEQVLARFRGGELCIELREGRSLRYEDLTADVRARFTLEEVLLRSAERQLQAVTGVRWSIEPADDPGGGHPGTSARKRSG